MSLALYKAMLAKTRGLLKVESTHSEKQRKAQQWQLLFSIDGTQYIVGKGGVNTTFYKVGDGERKLCYPEELLTFLEALTRKKYSSYAIYSKDGKPLETGIMTEADALKKKASVGSYIVALNDGKKIRLFIMQAGIFKPVWQPFKLK